MNQEASLKSLLGGDGEPQDDGGPKPEQVREGEAVDLYYACKENDSKLALQLIDEQVQLHYVDPKTGWTALHWSTFNGNVPLVKVLLKEGASNPYHDAKETQAEAEAEKADNLLERKFTKADVAEKKASHSFLVNTPLHWAAYKGNLSIIWLLLQHGYSPDDVDQVGNTSLHLAASNGHARVLETLLADGANPHVCNMFMNTPLDCTSHESCKTLLQHAQARPAPQPEQREKMHAENLESPNDAEQRLEAALSSGPAQKSSAGDEVDPEKVRELMMNQIAAIEDAAHHASDLCIGSDMVDHARTMVASLLLQHQLIEQIALVAAASPIVTQSAYTTLVNKLKKLLQQATSHYTIPVELIEQSTELVERSHSEYWLQFSQLSQFSPQARTPQVAWDKLKGVERGPKQLRGMDKLETTLEAARNCNGDAELITGAAALLRRLKAQVQILTALTNQATVRMPPVLEEGQKFPKDWWKEEDIGRITEHEGYPLPPVNEEGQEVPYEWEASASLQKLRASQAAIIAALEEGKASGAEEDLLAKAATSQAKTAKELKVLEEKDTEDREKAVALATKAAKKLKKGKKGKAKGG